MQKSVQQAISSMHSRYFDSMTLKEIASEVFVSPYHFSRIFSRAMGVTPGRYLAAIRLFEAKRLLLTTSLTVSDIVCSVGYNSVGTFTSRFTRAVGMSPTQYRDPGVSRLLVAASADFQRLPTLEAMHEALHGRGPAHPTGSSITGTLELPLSAGPVNVLVGVFSSPIPQQAPVAYQALTCSETAELAIHGVPAGRWTVIALARPTGASAETVLIGNIRQPLTVTAGNTATVNLRMRALEPTDPPLAFTLASPVIRPRSGHTGRRNPVGQSAA